MKTTVTWIGIVLLVVSWLFPWWNPSRGAFTTGHPPGIYFLFDPWNYGLQIDWTRMLLLDLVIVSVIGGILYTLRGREQV